MNHVLCDGGLCNRLNALIFALILQRRYGHPWTISWPRNNWCGASFDSLFKAALPVDERSIEDYKAVQHEHRLLMHENQIGFDPSRLVINRQLVSYDDYEQHLSSGESIVYFNSLLPSFVTLADVRDALSLLQVNDSVAAVARDFIGRHQIDGRTVGLHIRKTDFGNAVDDEALYRQAQTSTARFFVCSDDADVNRRFAALPNCAVFGKTAFPDKLERDATWQHWTTDAEGRRFPFNITRSAASVVEGLVDLLVLSQTEIVPTSHSTFLATARLFGRCGFFSPAAQRSPMNERPVTAPELLELLNLVRPWQMISDVKVRIGSDADGGYVMPSSSRRSNAVLSIGIGEEVSFDNDLAALGARVIQFDHTIEASPSRHPNIEFHRKGWGTADRDPFVSLASMVRMLDWTQARHAILKFDTEGAEWGCLDAASGEDLARFEVLTGEFHDFHNLVDRGHFETVRRVLEKLDRTHRVIHLHANNAGGMVMLGGIPFPRLLELTWMRRSSATFHGHSWEPIPGPLDRPNVPQLPDLHLRAF